MNKLKKVTNDNTVIKKDIRKSIEDRIIRDIRNFLGHKLEDYHKPVWLGNFWSNNYTEHESKSDRGTMSLEEYEIRPCLKDIINNLKRSDIWKN